METNKNKTDLNNENGALIQSCVSVSVTDLRIGNYISRLDLGSGTPRTEQILELLAKRAVTTGPCRVIVLYEDIKPIPLTEKRLLQFGFVKYGKLHDSYKLNPFIVELGILGNHYTFRKIMNKDESMLLKEMKYVHELQNIYKELKGYELQRVDLTEH